MHGSLQSSVLIILVILGVTLAATVVIGNRATRPLAEAVAALNDIADGEGDLTRRLKVQGKDETASLAGWFNQFLSMIAQLVQRIGNASSDLQTAAADTSAVANNMNQAAGRQREAVELVSTAFNEMVATANEVARSCSAAATSADEGYRDVHTGQQHIGEATGSVLTKGTTFARAPYDVIRQPFADLQAQTDAKERAAHEVSTDIRIRIAAWFAKQQQPKS